MTTEVIQPLTTTEAARLAVLEERIAATEDAALEWATSFREIRDDKLYRITHGTFKLYCADRGKKFRSVNKAIQVMNERELISEMGHASPIDQNPVIQAFTKDASANAVMEVAKIKQARRLETIIEANSKSKGEKITAKAVKTARARLDHRPIPARAAQQPDAFANYYGMSDPAISAAPPPAIQTDARDLSLEEFRIRISALNIPASARLDGIKTVRFDQPTNKIKFT